MTDYQPTEQDRVLLDFAQTRLEKGAESAHKEFQYCRYEGELWEDGYAYGPQFINRRKPRTCKLIGPDSREWDLPVPFNHTPYHMDVSICRTDAEDAQWLAALREIAGGENG